ncbi:hypothetical protein HYV58_00155 [Candidatus Peregrinibacteria bacterium]|nr:hypothetical protein [Candidatus Peregrinibacteria bacterium]
MNPSCIRCAKPFTITGEEIKFLEKIAPVVGGQKVHIPPPISCPDCRSQLRTAHRNEQYLYHNKSAASGQPLISLYSPTNEWSRDLKIYSHEEWWSESWDALQFGQDFDFARPFFDQFSDLMKKVPHVALIQVNNENSPFTTGTGFCKNCHLISCSENCRDCYYGKLIQNSSDIIDSDFVYDSQLCYGCFQVKNCYNCVCVNYSQNSSDCFFSENLRGCRNCLFSTNLNNKEYYYMNQPLVKEEYAAKLQEVLGSREGFKKAHAQLQELRKKRVYKYANIINSENSTGDFLLNCKNCTDCFDMNNSQDCKYVTVGVNTKDLVDCSNMYLKPELCYQVLGTIAVYNCIFSLYVFHSQNLMYSQFCYNSNNLFGCFGLKKNQYCIFNKQYTKEQYETLVPRIIEHMEKTGEWGRFFPPALSPFGYNETVAHEYFPLNKEQAVSRGFHWKEDSPREYAQSTAAAPDNIQDVKDDITKIALACEICGKNYRIIPQELQRLKEIPMPLSRRCPDCRYKERMKLRNPRHLWERTCMKCSTPIMTTYAPERPERVLCEKCYMEAIY